MADIWNWPAFIRGRWMWTTFGYERGFPRGCGFGDLDAALEFDGKALVIEAKAFDGIGDPPPIPTGQRRNLEHEASLGKTALLLYGCGACNDPLYVVNIGTGKRYDLRRLPKLKRRAELKFLIDEAMGLVSPKRANALIKQAI